MTNTDKTVSTERQSNAELVEQLRRLVDDQEDGDAVVLVQRQLFNRVVGRLAETLASRTQEPAEWQVEAAHAVIWPATEWPEGEVYCRDATVKALRAASITPPAPERSKEEVGKWKIRDPYPSELSGYHYADGPGDLRLRTNDRALLDRILSALEPASLHKGGAVWGIYLTDGRFMDIASDKKEDAIEMAEVHYEPGEYVVRPLYASPAPLPVTITPDPAFLHGVCDSLRAAISEYEDRGLYPGARKIMQAQIDTLTAALSKPREQ